MRTALIALLALAVPAPAPASTSTSTSTHATPAPAPDLPMRRSAWLEQATDSKTCPIVRVRLAAVTPAEGDAVLATVWQADDDDRSDLGTWPALFISLRGRPLSLRRSDGDFDVEARTVQGRRGTELTWTAPAERVSARLRLQPPRQFIENGDGGWTPLSPGQARGDGDVGHRTVWRGALTMRIGEAVWTREVEVESLCGP